MATIETDRDFKINRCLRNTLRNFKKLHGLKTEYLDILQKMLYGNLKAELREEDWTHVSKSQQDDYDEKIRHLGEVIQEKNKSIQALVKKCKDAGIL